MTLWLSGLATIIVGILAYFFVSEAPADALWLSENKRDHTLSCDNAIALDLFLPPVISSGNMFDRLLPTGKHMLDAASSLAPLCLHMVSILALPTIINNLGFSAARVQGMSAPPYIFGCLVTIAASVLADKVKQCGILVTISFAIACVGFAIVEPTAGNASITGVTPFGIFLLVGGLYMATPPTMAWAANIFEGEVKRGIASSIVPTIGQLGGVIGSKIHLTKEKPQYRTGFSVSLAFCVLGLIPSVALRVALSRVNAKRDRLSVEKIHAKYTQEQLTEMGDMSPLIRVSSLF